MTKKNQHDFTFQEIAEIMIKDRGIHEGRWRIYVTAAINAAHAKIENEVKPVFIVPIGEIGLVRADGPEEMVVDASLVNPKPKSKKAAGKKSTVRKKVPKKKNAPQKKRVVKKKGVAKKKKK